MRLPLESYMEVNPPLIDDFFQIALKLEEYNYLHEDYSLLYEYIYKNWGKSKVDLKICRLSLEDCFTRIEVQLNQAIQDNDDEKINELLKIKYILIFLFINMINLFERKFSIESSEEMSYLGKYIYKNKPDIITFNYDYFIERSIEKASKFKVDPATIEMVWGWKRALGYGIKFDEIETFNFLNGDELIKGEEYYEAEGLYSWRLLKLHGSLNWFQYLPLHMHPDFAGGPKSPLPAELAKRTILRSKSLNPMIMGNFDINGRYVSPIIITPEIHKGAAYKRYAHVFDRLWELAEKTLYQCKNLVLIGYSFPKSDTRTKELFERAFYRNNNLENLTIINPDRSIDSRAKNLCDFNKSIERYDDMKTYLRSLGME